MGIFSKRKAVSGYKLNWKKSPFDARDFKFKAIVREQVYLPSNADLLGKMPEVFDQGQVGSCTGNAGAMLGLYQSRLQNREISPSRLMLYYGAREIEGSTESDAGAYIRDIFKAWSKVGVAPESVWPYDESKVTARPNSEAYAVGKKTLAVSYHALDNTDITELKTCLAMGHPFELGFMVYRNFMYGNWKDTMPMPTKNEQILGGHAVTAIGYDDSRQAFRIKNSWGNDWKDGGCFWMPYAFITNPNYCDDFWMLDGITPGESPAPTPSNITSIVDLKNVFKEAKWISCLRKNEIVAIGVQMGINTSMTKTKKENAALVSGGLGL
jgi:C1A family cysteine protease